MSLFVAGKKKLYTVLYTTKYKLSRRWMMCLSIVSCDSIYLFSHNFQSKLLIIVNNNLMFQRIIGKIEFDREIIVLSINFRNQRKNNIVITNFITYQFTQKICNPRRNIYFIYSELRKWNIKQNMVHSASFKCHILCFTSHRVE